nr:PolC-type DNA polymerase III [bacterium]
LDKLERMTCSLTGGETVLTVFAQSKTLLSPQEQASLLHALEQALPRYADIRLYMRYPALKEDFIRKPDAYRSALCGALRVLAAPCARMLSGAELSVREGMLVIGVDEVTLGYMQKRNCGEAIRRAVQQLFGLDMAVELEQTRTLQAERIQRALFAAPSAPPPVWEGEAPPEMEVPAPPPLPEEDRVLYASPVPAPKKAKPQAEGEEQAPDKAFRKLEPAVKGELLLGRMPRGEAIAMADIAEDSGVVLVVGKLIRVESKPLKKYRDEKHNTLLLMDLTDGTSSITAKAFTAADTAADFEKLVKGNTHVAVRGQVAMDRYQGELVLLNPDIAKVAAPVKTDDADIKRVELHLHTKMSAMDGLVDIGELVATAKAWGHDTLCVTDHGVVQAYPEAYEKTKPAGIKLVYGVEGYLVDDSAGICEGDAPLDAPMVVFDLETTGLSPAHDAVIEIGAVKVVGGEIVDRFSTFADPERPIPPQITKLTGIVDADVKGAPTSRQAIEQFLAFANGCTLCAHNGIGFDVGFLKAAFAVENPVLDTLPLARSLFPGHKSYKLEALCKRMQVKLTGAHRAVNDAEALAKLYLKMLPAIREKGNTLEEINQHLVPAPETQKSYHIILLVKNKQGLNNLYRLITESHLEYFHKQPRMPRRRIQALREGLLIGSACEAGELYSAAVAGADDARLRAIASMYDYLEIQPDGNNAFLLREGRVADTEALHDINRRILRLGDSMGKPVIATGDVHFLRKEDAIFREILMTGMGFDDAGLQAPLFYRTTGEMLEEFAYLGRADAHRVVVETPRKLAAMCETPMPFPDTTHAPNIAVANEGILSSAHKRAIDLYGDPPPEIVTARLERELNSIIGNNFGTLYWIAQQLVAKSMKDGYLVGSRGSVGSSFAATMAGISEVNPLPPHYRCPKCKFSDFNVDKETYTVGPDLPLRDCPRCGTPLAREGYDIPFEVFLGFDGDKVPDIDLNFSGEYQPTMHRYSQELLKQFGGSVYKAGTIGTLAERTCFGYVKKYLEEKGKNLPLAEQNRLAAGLGGVKRSTGQHPGGMVVVPDGVDVYDFTPLQYPADDKEAGMITTHFDFGSMKERLVKLDILGHDYPTMIRMLQDLTGVEEVPECDPGIMELYHSTAPLGVTEEDIGTAMGTLGLPEFGTPFVRGILQQTKPTTMDELIRIMGLSHGTNVWLGNAQDLIANGTVPLKGCICNRDDILLYLQTRIKPLDAFMTMESVRKGKGLVLKKRGDIEPDMREAGVPEWFIESCKKISYMFPKAHAVAYTIMANRIAYFKLYYPAAFYAVIFTVRGDFDYFEACTGIDGVRAHLKELSEKGNDITDKEEKSGIVLQILLEMLCRGIKLLPVDLYASQAEKFGVEEGGLRPPFTALPGLGPSVAQNIVRAREEAPFLSVEDLALRGKVNKGAIELLRRGGCLAGMSQSNQLTLLDDI